MEFKTQKDFEKIIPGNIGHLQGKSSIGVGEWLFTCKHCLSKFDDKKQHDKHEPNCPEKPNQGHPSYSLNDSDFKNGGDVFETLICDLCDKKKTSVFKSFKGGWVSCSDCTPREASK